jgi:hypothetical protein
MTSFMLESWRCAWKEAVEAESGQTGVEGEVISQSWGPVPATARYR